MFRFPLTQRPQISREPFSLQTLDKAIAVCAALLSLRASVLTAPSVAASSSSPRAVSSSTLRAILKVLSAVATYAPKGPTPFSSPSIRIASAMFYIALPTPITGRRRRWTGHSTRSPSASRRPATPISRRATSMAACSTRCAASARWAGQR